MTRVRRPARAQLAFEPVSRGVVRQRRVGNRKTPALLGELLRVAMCAERHDAKTVRVARDDIERRLANRAGGTQDRDANISHEMTFMLMSANTSAGAAAVTLSIRSSMPP